MSADYRRTLKRRGLAQSTIHTRMRCLQVFAEWLQRDALTATTEEIELFLDWKKLQARTRYNWISHLSNYYRWAIDHDHLERDPTVRVDRPKLPKQLPRPIVEADLSMAVEIAKPNRTMHGWLILAGWAGLRCAELAGLTSDAVMLDEGLIRVLGKGTKERIVPMHPRVTDALLSHGLPRSGHVFRRPRGARWWPEGVSREGTFFFDGLGMEWRMHSLRHRFGTRALAACGNLRTVQELMGHANPSTTAAYTAYSHEAGREAVLGLERDGSPLVVPLPFAAG